MVIGWKRGCRLFRPCRFGFWQGRGEGEWLAALVIVCLGGKRRVEMIGWVGRERETLVTSVLGYCV